MTAKQKRSIYSVFKFIVLALFLVIVMFPFVWMLLTSLKGSQGEIYAFPVKYLPNPVSFVNYTSMLWKGSFGTYMLNSLFVSAVAATCAVLIAILSAYVISRFHLKHKNLVMMFFLVTQMFPTFIMLAPLYQMLSSAGMLNRRTTLALLYTNMMIPFSVVTLAGFYDAVPTSLEEAAWIDGCGYLSSLFRVVVPVIKPGLASTFIFAFINSWNELFMAVMFIDVDVRTECPDSEIRYQMGRDGSGNNHVTDSDDDPLWLLPEIHDRRSDCRFSQRIRGRYEHSV